MRISSAISLLILALATLIGWRDHGELSRLRAEREKLSAEALERGISLDDAADADHAHPRTKRERADKLVEARRAALDIIALARELERLQESGEATNIETQDRILGALEQLSSLNADQLTALIAEFRDADGLGDEMRKLLLNVTVRTLAERNPKAALELLAGNGNPLDDLSMRRGLVLDSLSNWSQTDPSGALAWVRASNLDFLYKQTMETALVVGTARSDLSHSLNLIREFGISAPGNLLVKIAGDLRAPSQRAELLRMMKAQPDQYGEKEMNAVLVTMGRTVGKDGYEEGVRWITENKLGEAEITNLIAGGLVSHAKGAEMGRWIEWMGESLSEEPRDRYISERVSDWTASDHRAAGEWLAALPDGAAKPASVAAFAKTVAPHDPQVAAQWALTLPPGVKRTETLKAVYEKWPQDDPAREAFMAEHPVE
jgi:hypothetical protein